MVQNVIYTKVEDVILSCSSLQTQKTMLEQILVNMLGAITTATLTGQFVEYKLDTGQTKSEIRYRDLLQLQKAYAALFQSYQIINNALGYTKTGRRFQLVPGRSFPGYGGGYGYGAGGYGSF